MAKTYSDLFSEIRSSVKLISLEALKERLESRAQKPFTLVQEATVLAHAFDAMADGLKERERLRGTLGRYISNPVAERILSEESDLMLRVPGRLPGIYVIDSDAAGKRTFQYWRDGEPACDLFELPDWGSVAESMNCGIPTDSAASRPFQSRIVALRSFDWLRIGVVAVRDT